MAMMVEKMVGPFFSLHEMDHEYIHAKRLFFITLLLATAF